jgi:hypothetical protein
MRTYTLNTVVAMSLAALCGCAAWDGSASAAQQTARQTARQEAQARAAEPNASRETITIEFDATDDVVKKAADGTFLVRAFQVGFFDGSTLVRTVEVSRERAEISGTRVKLVVPVVVLSRGPSRSASVHVRSLSSGPVGEWSGSAGSVHLEAEASARTSRRGRDRAGAARDRADAGNAATPRARRTVTVAELHRHPALKDALTPMLSADLDAEKVARSFKRVQDLALAVVIARKHDVPLARICGAMQEDQRRTVTTALKSLSPRFDVEREVDAARPEARTLAGRPAR